MFNNLNYQKHCSDYKLNDLLGINLESYGDIEKKRGEKYL